MNAKTPAVEGQPVPVTAIISRRVRPGCEQAFEEWLQGISQAAAQFPGHQGVSIPRPNDPENAEYVIVLKFDAVPHLREWLKSNTRREWIGRSDKLTETPDKITELTGLEAWFTLPGQPMPAPPPRWKMFLLTLLAAYPLIMVVTTLLGRWLGQSPWLFNFVVTVALTTLLTYFAMPLVTRIFYTWLYPRDSR